MLLDVRRGAFRDAKVHCRMPLLLELIANVADFFGDVRVIQVGDCVRHSVPRKSWLFLLAGAICSTQQRLSRELPQSAAAKRVGLAGASSAHRAGALPSFVQSYCPPCIVY